MKQFWDPHIDEDRLAAWILEEAAEPSEAERSHLSDCPVCSKRVAALRRLEVALDDLDLQAAPDQTVSIPPDLSAGELSRRSRRGNRTWAVAGLAAAAVLAFVVPRVTVEPRLTWTDSRTAGLIGERTVEVLAGLSPAMADSLVVQMVALGVPAHSVTRPDVGAVELLDSNERETLYMLIRHRLEGERSLDAPANGGGI